MQERWALECTYHGADFRQTCGGFQPHATAHTQCMLLCAQHLHPVVLSAPLSVASPSVSCNLMHCARVAAYWPCVALSVGSVGGVRGGQTQGAGHTPGHLCSATDTTNIECPLICVACCEGMVHGCACHKGPTYMPLGGCLPCTHGYNEYAGAVVCMAYNGRLAARHGVLY